MMCTALIVDDSRTIRMILRRILIEMGYEVCEASNGVEALQVVEARNNILELVLADWNMPEMNGLDLVKNLRLNPALESTKIVMVTTEAELTQMIAALEAGADEYVMKPFTKEILLEKLALIGVHPMAGV
jgi:two-component system chemotaxis response regulator CheY